MELEVSICGHFSASRKDACGYCHTSGNSHSHGMVAYSLSITDYQNLIDRGWRRSGTYLYKPTMNETCCPAYTIKCNAVDLNLSKSQKKILKRFNKYLCSDCNLQNLETEVDLSENSGNHESAQSSEKMLQSEKKMGEMSKMSCSQESVVKGNPSKGVGPDPNKAPCKKAKQLRAEKKELKLRAKGITPPVDNVTLQNKKSIEDFLNDLPGNIIKKLEVKLVKSSSIPKESSTMQKIIYRLYTKYQNVIHNDPIEKNTWRQFSRFLVNSPLKYEKRGSIEYGSFHQQYWLDGELIAVGVVDILPKCVSSVYFFYDPDYNELSIGTYGALRELSFTRELQKINPEIKNYYMGFYIHSCVKMRYKGNFFPSYLLCPETYEWFPIKEACEKLNKERYSRLNNDLDAVDVNYFSSKDMDFIPILSEDGDDSTIVLFNIYKQNLRPADASQKKNTLIRYGELVGKECSKCIVIYFDY